MIEKVTLLMTADGKNMKSKDNVPCDEINPKAMMLYAGAKCAGLTAMMIMKQSHVVPKRFELSVAGELTTDELRAESEFRSFHYIYNIECSNEADQLKLRNAADLAHEKYCGLAKMFAKIAPVTHEIAVVCAERAKAW